MYIETSVGSFTQNDFIQKCSDHSFPEGLEVRGALLLRKCDSLKYLPAGLQVRGWLDLRDCVSLTALPAGLHVGGYLDLRRCSSLMELPDELQVGGNIYVDQNLIEQYPFRSIPKILHLPFQEDKKKILLERLQNGY